MNDEDPYVAHGDIVVAVGRWKNKTMRAASWKLEVESASQLGHAGDCPA
jgi:hypothetical protein